MNLEGLGVGAAENNINIQTAAFSCSKFKLITMRIIPVGLKYTKEKFCHVCDNLELETK